MAVKMSQKAQTAGTMDYTKIIGVVMLAIALFFVYRSFYGMRIKK
jgi:K(+)-stimulated pyrophosphate-energized sodium pump